MSGLNLVILASNANSKTNKKRGEGTPQHTRGQVGEGVWAGCGGEVGPLHPVPCSMPPHLYYAPRLILFYPELYPLPRVIEDLEYAWYITGPYTVPRVY